MYILEYEDDNVRSDLKNSLGKYDFWVRHRRELPPVSADLHFSLSIYIWEKCKSADTRGNSSYVVLKNHISRMNFQDPITHYHLHILWYMHIKNQVIWSLFTLFSLSSNINDFLTIEHNRTIRSMSKWTSNHLIFYMCKS